VLSEPVGVAKPEFVAEGTGNGKNACGTMAEP
jgi:hypothetical protein